MLIINAKPYAGRYRQRAVDLVKSGVRVGMMYISGAPEVYCHVCNKNFTSPTVDDSHGDAFGECSWCHTPFVFVKLSKI